MSDAPGGLGHLARRWGQWASNLLVSGIVLVVALALGREVLQWWYVKPAPLTLGRPGGVNSPTLPTNEDPLGRPGTSEELRFGELPFAFGHGVVEGQVELAMEVLRRECERAAAAADAAEREPGPAEQRLLTRLRGEKPVSAIGTRWSTYVIARPVPMAVAVSGTEQTPAERRRVLAWGLLLPERLETSPDSMPPDSGLPDSGPSPSSPPTATRWGWFTWRPSRSDATSSDAAAAWPQLPEGQRSLAIRTADGGARIAYVGTGSPDRWREAFDRWFADQGWRGSSPTGAADGSSAGGDDADKSAPLWQKLGRSWSRRYTRASVAGPSRPAGPKTAALTSKTGQNRAGDDGELMSQEAEVQVILERTGTLRALLIVSPLAAGQ